MRLPPQAGPEDLANYYAQVAPLFSRIRHDREAELEILLKHVCSVSRAGDLVLDVGCGPLRYFQHFRAAGLNIIGIDLSLDQLLQAPIGSARVLGTAHGLPFSSGSFALVTMILVIHQLGALPRMQALREALRVLNENGHVAIKTSTHANLRRRSLGSYFPSALPVNLRRYPDEPELQSQLASAGFVDIRFHSTETRQMMRTDEYLWSIESMHNSTLALLPREEFRRGLMQLKGDLSMSPIVSIPHHHTIVTARKPPR